MEEEKIETTINVNGTFPVGLPVLLCSPLGRIDEVSLKEMLESCEKDVLGWYSFRRNSNHRPTMRETILHKELCKTFTHIIPQCFLFCVITTSDNDGNATYSHKFTFSTFNRRRFIPVSVVQTNLGEAEDINYSRNTVVDSSFTHLQQVLHSLNGLSSSKNAMDTLHVEMNKHVDVLEQNVSRLQAEVDSYIHRITTSNHSLSVVEQKSLRRDHNIPSTSAKLSADELSVEY
ncbi:BRCA1-A complex subunit Abraxas 1-like [Macrosteles quadrilineatus]|uniref:BRCA1-A complex subunit Abraxas 1-like n=1 Tax=Macrosteles quadrilineatus TaxID=74068 RepID=UPI0023E2CDF1|nr:BRCA1-A complex subunit Abraxas 1-like [Macrosteles quadrilineatus]